MDNTIRVACSYRYDKPTQNYHFMVTVNLPGSSEGPRTETVVPRSALVEMKAFKGSHQKRAEQMAQALLNEKEVVLKTALRKCMAQLRSKEAQ